MSSLLDSSLSLDVKASPSEYSPRDDSSEEVSEYCDGSLSVQCGAADILERLYHSYLDEQLALETGS